MSSHLMKPAREVGIAGYGAYVPRYRLPASEVGRMWEGSEAALPIREKSVPGLDEDVVTMSIEAGRNALRRADIDPSQIGAVWIGSESHPYAVKPTGTIVAEALGVSAYTLAADWQFACKAGTEALQAAIALTGSGMAEYALAIGMDIAQARPGDALEYTAGAGGAALIVGPADESIAILEGSVSFVTDTPDFWRRQHERYPQHGSRFTGEPGYFRHVGQAASDVFEALGTSAADYAHVVLHQPNRKFPTKAAAELGFKPEQVGLGMLSNDIGNTYAGATMLGLTAILDQARPGERILAVSFGSGAGSDAFSFRVTERVRERQHAASTTRQYIERRVPIDYATYTRFRRQLAE